MKIISPFKDYYDYMKAYDEDNDSLFIRKKERIVSPVNFKQLGSRPYYGDNFSKYIIGFCGKLYPILMYTPEESESTYPIDTVEEFDKFFEKSVKRKRNRFSRRKWFFRSISYNKKYYHEFLSRQIPFPYKLKNYPIFIAHFDSIKVQTILDINPNLEKLKFYREFPGHEAYRELQIYIANLSNPEKPIPEIDDVTMAEAKGFDKYSFRKGKQK